MTLKIYHHYKDLPQTDRGAAVAYGNFDGVHVGHRAVIADAAAAAARLGVPLGVVSLEPHPQQLFRPEAPPFRLTNPHQMARAVEQLGAERLYLVPFGHQMAGLSERDFVKDILVAGLGVRHVAVGFDVTFAKDRTGGPESMRRSGEEFGFTVSVTAEVDAKDGLKISSSAVRQALRQGRPDQAAQLLGRPFAIEGVVQKGQQLGRKLGIPTANVFLGEYVAPRFGVYATRTRLKDGRHLPGVANIGVNPTTGEVEPRLEVWLFDFDEDIYGETIEVDLVAFQRPEEKYPTIEIMLGQIAKDAALARSLLA
ncbi:MAG: bifunctional riboflavin kinase/FAD synthetase [Caulobacterales bacterium]